MRLRALDVAGDMQFGHGRGDFLQDVPSLVAQRAKTRLGLWVGDWYQNTTDGTPYTTAIFGMRTNATRDPAVRARLLGTPGCTGISRYSSQQDRTTRRWSVQAVLDTAYGRTIVSAPTSAPNEDVRQVR